MLRKMMTSAPGSSPHTRGAQADGHRRTVAGGIIPAYAGSTFRIRRSRARKTGSSPHTRGAPCVERWASPRRTDHPRIRGEHYKSSISCSGAAGSSPHTRGALASFLLKRPRAGIIPAYAGSTFALSNTSRRDQDHPRIRGEHHVKHPLQIQHQGSSPHTRGAPPSYRWSSLNVRIIPAYAGSTLWWSYSRPTRTDHPRIRGEHRFVRPRPGSRAGSSPHTRGALGLRVPSVRVNGIIPAYAGSTYGPTRSGRRPSDHPRIRGEHRNLRFPASALIGSSPHTRGAPPRCFDMHVRERIIPAYAGSTPLRLIYGRRSGIIPAYAGSTPQDDDVRVYY